MAQRNPEALTDKERAFVAEYPKDFNITAAAIRAGYSKSSARQVGCGIMRRPRVMRAYVNKLTPAELAIRAAIQAVEALPADVRLTDAVVLLDGAGNAVADYVDGIERRRAFDVRDGMD